MHPYSNGIESDGPPKYAVSLTVERVFSNYISTITLNTVPRELLVFCRSHELSSFLVDKLSKYHYPYLLTFNYGSLSCHLYSRCSVVQHVGYHHL